MRYVPSVAACLYFRVEKAASRSVASVVVEVISGAAPAVKWISPRGRKEIAVQGDYVGFNSGNGEKLYGQAAGMA